MVFRQHTRRGAVPTARPVLFTVAALLTTAGFFATAPAHAGGPSAASITLTRVSVPTTAQTTCPTAGATTGQIAVDPSDSNDEVASWETGQGAEEWLGRSADGGATWTSDPLPGVTICSGQTPGGYVVDPFLAVAPGGAAVATSSWQYEGDNPVAGNDVLHVYVNRSAGPSSPPGPAQSLDSAATQGTQRAQVAIEAGQPSHVLVATEQAVTAGVAGETVPPAVAGSVLLFRSTDGGASFAAPVTVASATPGSALVTGGIADTPTGSSSSQRHSQRAPSPAISPAARRWRSSTPTAAPTMA